MKQLLTSILVLVLLCGASAPLARAAIIADAVAEFSSVQGQDNWFYGYYDGPFGPVDFQQMIIFRSGVWFVDPDPPSPFLWTQLLSYGAHSNGITTTQGRDPVEQWAVRRYISEVAGQITLSGNIADVDADGGNGIIGRIFVGDTEVYSATINNGDLSGVNYSLTANVSVGTVIDFAIDPRSSNDLADSSLFTAVVSVVPEPSSVVLTMLGVGIATLVRYRSRQAPVNALSQQLGRAG